MTNSTELYPSPGNPSNPPIWGDIERLAQYYPHLYATVTRVRRGELTREQGLILAVFTLADAFHRLFSAEVERLMTRPGARHEDAGQ